MRLFAPFPGVEIAVTERSDGNMSAVWEDAVAVLPRRAALYDRLGWPTEHAALLHVPNAPVAVLWVDAATPGNLLDPAHPHDYQGLATEAVGVPLNLLIADCAPLVLFDAAAGRLALVHAGWRETNAGMPAMAVDALVARGSDPAGLHVWIGPGIRDCCYRFTHLGEDMVASWRMHVTERDGGFMIDNPGFIRAQLLDAGVQPSNIIDTMECTAHDETQFSHYRDATLRKHRDEGRFLVAVRQTG